LPSDCKSTLEVILSFAAYANHHPMALPFQQVVADTAAMRELVSKAQNIQPKDPQYAKFMRAPYVNTSLFPGCAQALVKSATKSKRAHSFYSRRYKSKGYPFSSDRRRNAQ
jgi:hypothetical protein